MTARNGFSLGNTVIHRLRNSHQFTVERNDEWDAKNHLDFVVFYIPNLTRIQSTGVQMTQKLDDAARISEYLDANSADNRLVDRILYIEVDPALQLDGPGGDMIAFVIRNFQMDRSWQNADAAGARLFSNMTYEMFSLRDGASRSRGATTASPTISSPGTPAAQPPASGDPSELVRALQHRRTQITG